MPFASKATIEPNEADGPSFGRALKISQNGCVMVIHDGQARAHKPLRIGGSGLKAKRWLLEPEGAL
jgi:hypothetical protein